MVEPFVFKGRRNDGTLVDGNKLIKQIRDRCDNCYRAECWTFKDHKDKGQIHLSRKYTTSGKWRKVQIRQVLFQMAYKHLPPEGRTITTACHNSRCCNPAHFRVAGWLPDWPTMHRMIDELGWITAEQAKEMHSVILDESSYEEEREQEKQELAALPKWHEIYQAQ